MVGTVQGSVKCFNAMTLALHNVVGQHLGGVVS